MDAVNPGITIELFPASYGDAALVRCIGRKGTTNILVDGGPPSTYDRFIKRRLAQLSKDGEDLALVVVSHIDDDHIGGILSLIANNGPASSPTVIGIRDVWHNSYRHLPLSGRPPTSEEVARVNSQTRRPSLSPADNISARQGSCLAALLRHFDYPWNAAVSGGPIVATVGAPPLFSLNPSVSITILSPLPTHLSSLSRLWRRELLRLGVAHTAVGSSEFEEAFEAFLLRALDLPEDGTTQGPISSTSLTEPLPASAFREDTSVPNASSIALLIECEGVSVAMLGDSLPTVIQQQLTSIGRTSCTALKVSHHGSMRNTSPSLVNSLTCPHYLISTDGTKHAHPDLATLLWIADSQSHALFHFNYDVSAAHEINGAALRQRYGHDVQVARAGEALSLALFKPS